MPTPESPEPGPGRGASASRSIARNSALYFSSLALPALAAVFLVPVTVHALGAGRFGLLALAWAVAEGSGMFDFGLGRATVRFVADGTARGPERVEEIVIASSFFQTVAGLIPGLLLFALAPVLVKRVFTISPEAMPEAIGMFRVLALNIPFLFGLASHRAALEGAQRFDLSTKLKLPGSLASVIIPAIAASAGCSLVTIMWLLLSVRVILFFVSGIAVSRTMLPDGWSVPSGFSTIFEMLRYSGWVAVSAFLGPALGSFDRFVVGSVVGVVGLGYYTGAAEGANRFLLIPATAFAALLPVLAHTDASGQRDRALTGIAAARRQLAALLFPVCLVLFIFAPVILRLWLGPAFAVNAGLPLRILSVGVFLTGLAHLPLALLYGSGRPDLAAKIHVVQAVVHVPLTYVLVKMFGITGAAIAWSIRCGEDLLLYEWMSRRAVGTAKPDAAERARVYRLTLAAVSLGVFLAGAVAALRISPLVALALVALGLAAYAWFSWLRVLSPTERAAWLSMRSSSMARAA